MKTLKNKIALILVTILATSMLLGAVSISPALAAVPLDPITIPKYVDPLVAIIPVYTPTNVLNGAGQVIEQDYYVNITQFTETVLPASMGLTTTVWGYGGVAHHPITGANLGYFRNSPSATFNATKGVPMKVTWVNNLTDPISGALLKYLYPVDPTLHWANPRNIPMDAVMMQAMMGLAPPYPPGYNGSAILNLGVYTNPNQWDAMSPVPVVTHVHGAEPVISGSDGGPDQWWTPNGIHGPDYWTAEPTYPNAAVYVYNNTQEESTIWYHDHALGVTRINVYSGLAGFYILSDPAVNPTDGKIPAAFSAQDVPLAIQDRSFFSDGSFRFNVDPPPNPDMHPYWVPEFFGDTFMVNGKTWPYFNVTETSYRFRLLDGCNARFLNLSLIDLSNGNATVPFTVIARDQGYLNASVVENNILLGPGMRAEILVNFTGLVTVGVGGPVGHKLLLKNIANAPFPGGLPVVTGLTDEIMQFTVTPGAAAQLPALPATLNPTLTGTTWPTIPANTVVRQRVLTLREVMGMGGPLEVLQDGQKWSSPASEFPIIGTTEQWSIVNPTADAHPMHWHFVQFQLVSRQPFDDINYIGNWTAVNGMDAPFTHPTINVGNLSAFFTGPATGPEPDEIGWLDTVTSYPAQITTVRIRYTLQTGSAYTIDPTTGPGYVWHCHIVDHEDNEMMRRLTVVNAANQTYVPPIYAAVRGMDNTIWYRTFATGTSTWGSWNALPAGSTNYSPAIAQYNGILYFAVQGTDGSTIWFGSLNLTSSAFSGWTAIGGSTPSAPTLVSYGSKLLLVVRGENNIIYHRSYETTTGIWSGWIGLLGGSTCDTPTAAVVGSNLHLVARGFSTTNAAINNTLWFTSVDLTNNNYSGWTSLSGSTDQTPRIVNPENENSLILIVRATTGEILYNKWDGTTWLGWNTTSGSTPNSPAITILNQKLYFLVNGNDGALYFSSLNPNNNAFSGWTAPGGSSPSAPALTR